MKEVEIRDAIAEVTRDRTTLLIAHRATTIALADRVVLLHEGRVVDTGTHTELLSRSALYRTVLARADEATIDPSTTRRRSIELVELMGRRVLALLRPSRGQLARRAACCWS